MREKLSFAAELRLGFGTILWLAKDAQEKVCRGQDIDPRIQQIHKVWDSLNDSISTATNNSVVAVSLGIHLDEIKNLYDLLNRNNFNNHNENDDHRLLEEITISCQIVLELLSDEFDD